MPLNIQSASTSPHIGLGPPAPALPHFHDTVWTRPDLSNGYSLEEQPSAQVYEMPGSNSLPEQTYSTSPIIPSAPFANAGPPGFQFYTTPPAPAQPSPLQNSYNWSRGRRL